jgi:hypothetical protein
MRGVRGCPAMFDSPGNRGVFELGSAVNFRSCPCRWLQFRYSQTIPNGSGTRVRVSIAALQPGEFIDNLWSPIRDHDDKVSHPSSLIAVLDQLECDCLEPCRGAYDVAEPYSQLVSNAPIFQFPRHPAPPNGVTSDESKRPIESHPSAMLSWIAW